MLRRLHFDADDSALSLALRICSLPFIALIVFPAFGLKIAGLAAVALLVLFLILCRGTFRQRFVQAPSAQGMRSGSSLVSVKQLDLNRQLPTIKRSS